MSALRVVGWRRRVGYLPALVALLLAAVSGLAVVAPADGPTIPRTTAALGGAVTPAHPTVASTRADVRLLAKRSGHWTPGSGFAAGQVSAYRLAVPVGWRVVPGVAAGWGSAVCGQVYRGRAPPYAV